MPEVILREAESIDEALKRLKRAVIRDSTVKTVKQRLFEGAVTESQRRRAKTKKALRRWRKAQKIKAMGAYVNRSYANDEIKANFWADDTSWAISDTEWNPDLTPIRSRTNANSFPAETGFTS